MLLFNELEQKFHSRFNELRDVRTFCRKTLCPASLHSTDVGNFIFTLNTLWAGFDSTQNITENNRTQFRMEK